MDNKIKALITLFEDPDEKVFRELEKGLFEKGTSIVPDLELVWENSANELLHRRIEDIIENIQFSSVENNLRNWYKTEYHDLIKGAFYLSRYQYPELAYEVVDTLAGKIFEEISLEINDSLTPLSKIKVLNHIIFDIHKFSGNTNNLYSVQNCYINQVLDSKKGNTITIALLYAAFAQKLKLPVYGVNLPINFILAYLDENTVPEEGKEPKVQFYINPFNRGTVLGRREIEHFIKQQDLEDKEEHFTPCSNTKFLQQLAYHLLFSYEKKGYIDKVKEVKKLERILKGL